MRNITAFQKRVLEAIQKIPEGKITTYGRLARYLKKPGASRAVGQSLKKNPYPFLSARGNNPSYPCHRVVCENGFLGGFNGGKRKKKNLLKKEGLGIKNEKILNFSRHIHHF